MEEKEYIGQTNVRDWLNKHKNHDKKLEYKYIGDYQVIIQINCLTCKIKYNLDTYSIKD